MSIYTRSLWDAGHRLTVRAIRVLQHVLHPEAISGLMLVAAAMVALWCANSTLADTYRVLWETPLTIGIGSFSAQLTLRFVINDVLMTVFFLVVGLEIRRELHDGVLADFRQATLPLAAAAGGVLLPAMMYLLLVDMPALQRGWAVPIATDIAFALGMLALLGKRVPRAVRVMLLALAVVDDLIAILVIAVFYSGSLQVDGLLLSVLALASIVVLQQLRVQSVLMYALPAVMLWAGLLRFGVHPTLAGVMLGLMTPVVALDAPANTLREPFGLLKTWLPRSNPVPNHRSPPTPDNQIDHLHPQQLRPAVRLESLLHPWVAYVVMPVFAFANAGIELDGMVSQLSAPATQLALGISAGLLVGKPMGILLGCWLMIRCDLASLPAQTGWRGLVLVALLGGVGFTMSVFIATLAFDSADLLSFAKLATLLASAVAALAALIYGHVTFPAVNGRRPDAANSADR